MRFRPWLVLACAACEAKPRVIGTSRVYMATSLKAFDERSYAAAGLLAYRHGCNGGIDVLLGRQSIRCATRKGTWTLLGGKREDWESHSIQTAAREAQEESSGHITSKFVEEAARMAPCVLWQPTGGCVSRNLQQGRSSTRCLLCRVFPAFPHAHSLWPTLVRARLAGMQFTLWR
jgi:8-oxo-dGTP pyrophosphatase MutT (NUDIX family)